MTDLTLGDPSEKITDILPDIYTEKNPLSPLGLTRFRKFHLPMANVVALTALRIRATF